MTFHPETLAVADVPRQAEELMAALEKVDGEIIVTAPGADTAVPARSARPSSGWPSGGPLTHLDATLGDDVYSSLLREADVMVGNSSSGLIEAPSFGLPVVNVGDRQRGRLRAANVIDVGHDREAIVEAIRRALDPAFRRASRDSPIRTATATPPPASRRVLREVELGPRLVRKRFVDAPA